MKFTGDECSDSDLEDALIGSFWLTYDGDVNTSSPQAHRMSSDIYMASLEAIAMTEYDHQGALQFNPMVHQTFDAVWALATALTRTDRVMRRSPINRRGGIDSFTYGDRITRLRLKGQLLRTDFRGPSGRVRFKSNGDRLGSLAIRQYQGRKDAFRTVAFYDNASDQIAFVRQLLFNTGDNSPPSGR